MKSLKLILFTSVVILITVFTAKSQTAVLSAGGEAIGDDGNISYSIGQVSYSTYSETDGSISEGVQQPYEISMITEVADYSSIDLSISVYPNPTKDNVLIKSESRESLNLYYQLLDLNGKIIREEKMYSTEESIEMINLPPATYILRINEETNLIKSFKIIKN
jgi:hypothetical protein